MLSPDSLDWEIIFWDTLRENKQKVCKQDGFQLTNFLSQMIIVKGNFFWHPQNYTDFRNIMHGVLV